MTLLTDKCICCFEKLRSDKSAAEVWTLPCGHAFHKSCVITHIRIRPYCPLCKQNLELFLRDKGIKSKSSKIDYQFCCDSLDQKESFDKATVYNTFKSHRGDRWIFVYRDIIIDKLSNAEHLLSEISYRKQLAGQPGIFLYCTLATEFAIRCLNYTAERSRLEWLCKTEFKRLESLSEKADQVFKRIVNPQTDYGVLIIIGDDWVAKERLSYEGIINNTSEGDFLDNTDLISVTRLMSVDPEKKLSKLYQMKTEGDVYVAGMTTNRPSNADIIRSLWKNRPCRCAGHTKEATNAEYAWAKKYMARLHKKTNPKHHSS